MEEEAFPELQTSGYQAPAVEWRPKISAPPAAAAFSTEGMGTVFHVSWSHLPAPKKVQTKHIAQMLYPYACSVKYLDAVSAVVLVRPESSTAAVTSADALAHIDKHNTKDLAVVTLEKLATLLDSAPSHKQLVDYKGRSVRRMELPSAGQFRFLVAQLHHASLTPIDGTTKEQGEDEDDGDEQNRLYGTWLQNRWKATGAAKRLDTIPSLGGGGGEAGADAAWGDEGKDVGSGMFVCCDLGDSEKALVADVASEKAWSCKAKSEQGRVPDSWDESWATAAVAAAPAARQEVAP